MAGGPSFRCLRQNMIPRRSEFRLSFDVSMPQIGDDLEFQTSTPNRPKKSTARHSRLRSRRGLGDLRLQPLRSLLAKFGSRLSLARWGLLSERRPISKEVLMPIAAD